MIYRELLYSLTPRRRHDLDKKVLAIDAMGGDLGLASTVPAALNALKRFSDLQLILVGEKTQIQAQLDLLQVSSHSRLSIHHASEVVGMDESPVAAMRTKKDSSMRVALNLVRDQEAQACISSGNTGALVACSKLVLKTMQGVSRPAIMASLPTVRGQDVYAMDLGANVDVSAEQLLQFAIMGSLAISAIRGWKKPRVALLNVGIEEIKGSEVVKCAAGLIQQLDCLTYAGYIEGDSIFSSDLDLIICDGFVGNVALKTGEGMAKLIAHFARQEFHRNFLTRLVGAAAYPVIKRLVARLDPRSRNGATLLGLNGIVIKSHGSSDALAFTHAIEEARLEVDKQVPTLISAQVSRVLQELNLS